MPNHESFNNHENESQGDQENSFVKMASEIPSFEEHMQMRAEDEDPMPKIETEIAPFDDEIKTEEESTWAEEYEPFDDEENITPPSREELKQAEKRNMERMSPNQLAAYKTYKKRDRHLENASKRYYGMFDNLSANLDTDEFKKAKNAYNKAFDAKYQALNKYIDLSLNHSA